MSANKFILVDSGPLVAVFDPKDSYHKKAIEFFENNSRPLVTCDFVITEVSYFMSKCDDPNAAIERQSRFLSFMADSAFITRFQVENEDLIAAKDIMIKYADLPADLTDAILVNYAIRNNVYDVISVDKDFSAYRGTSKVPFNNLFINTVK